MSMEWKIGEAIAYYKKQGAPGDQNAVIGLLKEVQQELGGVPGWAVSRIAEEYRVKEGMLLALIRRIPSLRLADSHCLEVCAGPNCGKAAALAAAAERLQSSKITVKFVPCMRQCGKGPNVKWDGKLYHKADEALLRRLAEGEEDVQ